MVAMQQIWLQSITIVTKLLISAQATLDPTKVCQTETGHEM